MRRVGTNTKELREYIPYRQHDHQEGHTVSSRQGVQQMQASFKAACQAGSIIPSAARKLAAAILTPDDPTLPDYLDSVEDDAAPQPGED